MTGVAPVPGYRIEGHAIVSADDRIAGADGATPPSLSNDADWLRFQKALDAAAVIMLGRVSHEYNPNTRSRNRLIVSSRADGIEKRADGWWWNPARASLADALGAAAPGGGIVTVPGGHLVFDLLLPAFTTFHLARATGVELPGGIPLFSAVGDGQTADAVLAGDGLIPDPAEVLDAVAGVTLTVWRRPGT
jgi:hypothetical protein